MEKAAYTAPPRPARSTRSGTDAGVPHPYPGQGKECLELTFRTLFRTAEAIFAEPLVERGAGAR